VEFITGGKSRIRTESACGRASFSFFFVSNCISFNLFFVPPHSSTFIGVEGRGPALRYDTKYYFFDAQRVERKKEKHRKEGVVTAGIRGGRFGEKD